ncbi:hypothetical protein C0J52_13362 [Blattella germanica]|nr:hypothetical protein C0J52_13362 [Blattella germanica]
MFLLDTLRRKVWPKLLGLDTQAATELPSQKKLEAHAEYHQVVLDVNRSLKRFPPGIPYEQRVALQDQLTRLILRVIIKYPHLRYYQVREYIFFKNYLFLFHRLQLRRYDERPRTPRRHRNHLEAIWRHIFEMNRMIPQWALVPHVAVPRFRSRFVLVTTAALVGLYAYLRMADALDINGTVPVR